MAILEVVAFLQQVWFCCRKYATVGVGLETLPPLVSLKSVFSYLPSEQDVKLLALHDPACLNIAKLPTIMMMD